MSKTFSEQPRQRGVTGFAARLFKSFLIADITVLVSAVAWGTLSYFTGTVYLIAAIVIGFAVGFAVTYPFERIPFLLALPLLLPTIALALIAVLLGDYVYYAFLLTDQGLTLMEAFAAVAPKFVTLAAKDSAGSLVFALIGAFIGFVNAVRSAN